MPFKNELKNKFWSYYFFNYAIAEKLNVKYILKCSLNLLKLEFGIFFRF